MRHLSPATATDNAASEQQCGAGQPVSAQRQPHPAAPKASTSIRGKPREALIGTIRTDNTSYAARRMTALFLILLFARPTYAVPCAASPPAEQQRSGVPAELFDLFYAAKDSVDYGLREGHPPASLDQFARVTAEIVKVAKRRWELRYERHGSTYRITATERDASKVQYRGTREGIYRRVGSGKWQRVAGYCYF